MPWLDRAFTVAGWLFIAATVAIVLKPGGAAGQWLSETRLEMRRSAAIERNWASLVNSRTSVLGSTTDPHRLLIFIDYNCFYCKQFDDSTEVLLRDFPSASVRVRHLPNPANLGSRAASLAAICADRQGAFPAMHERLLQQESWDEQTDWSLIAEEIGVADLGRFSGCLISDGAARQLKEDTDWGEKLELRATPAVFNQRGNGHLGVVEVKTMATWLRLQ